MRASRPAAYRLLVTYNGKTFDAPFVRRCLGAPLDQPHIDLRYVLGSLGYRGGLKGCERQLGIPRQGLEDVDGAFSCRGWASGDAGVGGRVGLRQRDVELVQMIECARDWLFFRVLHDAESHKNVLHAFS